MTRSQQVFLSFSTRNRDQVRGVQRFLSERGIATSFDEYNLRAGQNWVRGLEEALNASRAVVVFVGPEMGRWQESEIGFALDRQAAEREFLVIPVLLDGAQPVRSFLFQHQCLDLRGERLHSLDALNGLPEALAGTTSPQLRIDINPYRGLEAFDEAHAPFFFGRERIVTDLVERLTEQRKQFVAVVGASGSGKSSVVRAGLIPKLRRRRPPNETWEVAVFTPGERPWFRLAAALGPLRFPDMADTRLDVEIERLAKALQSDELSIASAIERIGQPQGARHRLLLVIDQFEELFTLTPKDQRQGFIDSLVSSHGTAGLVLAPTLRADFYGQAIEANRRLSELLAHE